MSLGLFILEITALARPFRLISESFSLLTMSSTGKVLLALIFRKGSLLLISNVLFASTNNVRSRTFSPISSITEASANIKASLFLGPGLTKISTAPFISILSKKIKVSFLSQIGKK